VFRKAEERLNQRGGLCRIEQNGGRIERLRGLGRSIWPKDFC